MNQIPWEAMVWTNPPARADIVDDTLEVVTRLKSDFWQVTSYGFVRDDGHLLAAPFPGEAAIELTFRANFYEPFDQAGLMLRAAPDRWIKAGVELSDGVLFASAVVTLGHSDWSVAQLPAETRGLPITIRASRAGDAVTIRYKVGDGPFRLLRLAYLPPETEVVAGPMCCSPSRAGLVVRFDPVRVGLPDAALHEE
jgi:uncharacterized protein